MEEIVNRHVSITYIKSIINNLPKQNAPGPDGFTGGFYQRFKVELYLFSTITFKIQNQRKYFLSHSMKPVLT